MTVRSIMISYLLRYLHELLSKPLITFTSHLRRVWVCNSSSSTKLPYIAMPAFHAVLVDSRKYRNVLSATLVNPAATGYPLRTFAASDSILLKASSSDLAGLGLSCCPCEIGGCSLVSPYECAIEDASNVDF